MANKNIEFLIDEEQSIWNDAEKRFKEGKTWNQTNSEGLRKRLCNEYCQFTLDSYRHFRYLPDNHYLRDPLHNYQHKS